MIIRNDDSDSEEFDIEVRDIDSDDDLDVGVNIEETPYFIELCRVIRSLDVDAFRKMNIGIVYVFENDDGNFERGRGDGISRNYQKLLLEKMIKEGNDEAIAMLFREINQKRFIIETAIEAYFEALNLDKVESLLTTYPNINYQRVAIGYYAKLGMTEKVDALLMLEPSWVKDTQYVYAAYGHVQQAEGLLTRGGTVETLIDGYARGGHFDKVNEWIESKSRNQRLTNRWATLSGLIDGHFIKKEERLLKALSHIDSNATRVFLMDQPRIAFCNHNKSALLSKSKRLNHIMREYQLSYENAVLISEALAKPGFREWLLQARKNGTLFGSLPYDVFISVAMKLTKMPYHETEALYLAVCRNTHDGAKNILQHSMFANKSLKKRGREEPQKLDHLYDVKMRRIGDL